MITEKAYAKINLGLTILGKREDGYHAIETVFHTINLFDTIQFEMAESLTISSNDAALPVDNTNLCMKAALLLKEHFRVEAGASIYLDKVIPVGAGLGGGSSDAVATLYGLSKLWNLVIDKNELHAMALKLGSDVPYFLGKGSAYATGRGELLEYFHIDIPYWIVLVYPGIHVSTAWAYSQCKGTNKLKMISLKEKLFSGTLSIEDMKIYIMNDFETIVYSYYPRVEEVKKTLIDVGALFAQMSGSGSSVYGLFSSELAASTAMNELGKTNRVFLTPPNFQREEE